MRWEALVRDGSLPSENETSKPALKAKRNRHKALIPIIAQR
jgi:hypothetical protein